MKSEKEKTIENKSRKKHNDYRESRTRQWGENPVSMWKSEISRQWGENPVSLWKSEIFGVVDRRKNEKVTASAHYVIMRTALRWTFTGPQELEPFSSEQHNP